ncbi:MAG: EscI/YscI/HrpB family type III secretion system inner rod protein [Planctomycetota bacterium]
MSDPIASRVAQQAADQAAQQSTSQNEAQPMREVDALDQASFEDMLHAQSPQVESTQKIRPAEMQTDGRTIGDAMLDGLQRMKSSIDTHNASIEDQLSRVNGEMSVQDTMKLQVELMQMHLEQESIVKIGDKTSQGVQTMFKADK